MSLLDNVKTTAHAYSVARRLSLSRVSRLVFGDGTKLGGILDGRADLTTKRYEKTMLWFSDKWPQGADWPEKVPRPSSTLAAATECASEAA